MMARHDDHHDNQTAKLRDFLLQLTLPQQQMLFEYWLRARGNDNDWPAWRNFHMADLRALLPNLLLIEPRPQPEGMLVRLAGSALWDIHGREITGLTLQHRHWSRHGNYWRRVLDRALELKQPDCGHFNNPKQAAVVFWMRLPVRGNDEATWLLGLDISVPMSRATLITQSAEESPNDAMHPAERPIVSSSPLTSFPAAPLMP